MRSIPNSIGRHFESASFVVRYGVAVGATALATLLTALLWPFIQTSFFPLFSLAVLVSAWVGGLGPGLLVVALAGLANAYFLLPPYYSLAVTVDGLLKLSLFTIVAVFISVLTDRRKRAEEDERAQREYFQVTLASIGDAVIVTDPTGTVTFLNHVAEEVTGWTTTDALGKPLPDVFHIVNEETRQPVENPVAKVLRTGTVAGLANHTVLIRRDGSDCPIDDSAAPIRDARGRVLGIILVFQDITDRKQAEEAQARLLAEVQRVNAELQQATAAERAQREYFQTTLTSIGDAVIVTDAHGTVTFLNRVAEEVTGWTTAEAAGKSLPEVFQIQNEATRQPAENPVTKALREGGAVGLANHTVLIRKDGSVCPIDDSAAPIRDEHGRILGVILVFRDITARRQVEEALRESTTKIERQRRLYETILSNTLDLAYVFDRDHRFTYANDVLLRMWGTSWDEAIGKNCLELGYEPWHADMHDREIEQVIATKQPIRGEVPFPGTFGRRIYEYIFVPIIGTNGEVEAIVGTSRDVTERRQAEDALRESEERLRALFAQVTAGIAETDLAGRFTLVNQRYCDILGRPMDEVLRLCLQDVTHPEDLTQNLRLFERLVAEGRDFVIEKRYVRPDGMSVWVQNSVSREMNPDGSPHHAVAVVQDITARKAIEAERERLFMELQRINDELQQFAHIVSHDLNEPLRTMNNYVRLLARRLKGKLDDDATEFMAFVTDAAQRMQQMLTDLLAYTKAGQTPEFQPVDCEEVLAHVLSALQTRITECEAVVTHDPLPTIRGDATRLGQVLQNLIGNALKFCEVKPPRIHVSAVQEDHHWRFAVRDNGIGIDPQQAGKLFQVFQRLHSRSEYPGTGIGLAICKKIVEQHGGRIWVDSQARQGATFNFTINEKSSQHENRVASSQ